MAARSDRVYDELLCFLGDPIFQIPVRTFMDENSLIFDPSISIDKEHEAVHAQYKKLIDTLLDGFCQDAKISTEEAIAGISRMSQVPDLKEVFHVLFEQVLAATDFNIFCQVMVKRNIMIQEQVLVMIMAATGQIPDSFSTAKLGRGGAAPVMKGAQDGEEEEVLKRVMKQSQAEQHQADAMKRKEEAELAKTLEISKHEAVALEQERKAVEKAMEQMVLAPSAPSAGGPPPATKAPAAAAPAAASPSIPPPAQYAPKQDSKPKPAVSVQKAPGTSKITGEQAANQWLQSAQQEAATGSAAHSAIAASLSQLSPDELRKRQEFLKQQRDKLLALKKETREKQLGAAAKSQPQRPQSARAARSAMKNGPQEASSKEDQKKMAMRKAIAEKLREEVIANQ